MNTCFVPKDSENDVAIICVHMNKNSQMFSIHGVRTNSTDRYIEVVFLDVSLCLKVQVHVSRKKAVKQQNALYARKDQTMAF